MVGGVFRRQGGARDRDHESMMRAASKAVNGVRGATRRLQHDDDWKKKSRAQKSPA
jgi:hypothetical protein